MLKVLVGSLVLCHLLPVVNKDDKAATSNNPEVFKVLGEVLEINKADRFVENVEKKEVVRSKRDVLIVKGLNKPGMYQIDSQACMLVRDETAADHKAPGDAEKIEIPVAKPAVPVEDLPAEVKQPIVEPTPSVDPKKVNRSLVDFLK